MIKPLKLGILMRKYMSVSIQTVIHLARIQQTPLSHTFSSLIIKPKIKQQQTLIRQIYISLNLTYDEKLTDQQLCLNYITQWKTRRYYNRMTLAEFLTIQKKLKIIQFTKQQIATQYKYLSKDTQTVIYNFISYLTSHFSIPRLLTLTKLQRKIYETEILQTVNTINQFSFFINKDKTFCVRYLQIMKFVAENSEMFHSHEFTMHLRQVLDYVFLLPKSLFNLSEVIFFFNLFSYFNIYVWYFQKADRILMHFWNCLPNNWEKDPQNVKKLLKSVMKLSIESKDIKSKVWAIFNNEKGDTLNRINSMIILIRLSEINEDNAAEPSIRNRIVSILRDKECEDKLFRVASQEFYRSGIWLPQYWLQFFDYAQHNYSSLTLYNIYAIFELMEIFKQKIDIRVLNKCKKLQSRTKNQQKIITLEELQKQYDREYSSRFRRVNCQSQLANSFRLISKGQVRTQVNISIFIVDILIDNKYVVQVNGGSHFILDIDTGKKRFDLKSRFRETVLPKLGYKVFNLNISDFNEGSFDVIARTYNYIEQLEKVRSQGSESQVAQQQ